VKWKDVDQESLSWESAEALLSDAVGFFSFLYFLFFLLSFFFLSVHTLHSHLLSHSLLRSSSGPRCGSLQENERRARCVLCMCVVCAYVCGCVHSI